ncbi:MAG: hypothetical protein HYZ53_25450 [Planctomycetes bacterium]|nr:hypothetical protein [Planctomycetota bacterium]
MRYAFLVEPRPGIGFDCRLDEARLMRLPDEHWGLDSEWRDFKKKVAPIFESMYASFPAFRVSPEGGFGGAQIASDVVDRWVGACAITETGADRREVLARRMHSKRGLRIIERSVRRKWDCWVGAWVGLRMRAGETCDREARLPGLDGAERVATVHDRHLGPDPVRDGAIRLEAEMIVPPDAPPTAEEGGDAAPLAGSPPAKATRLHLKVVTDSATLQPWQASSDEREVDGGPFRGSGEHYEFEWPRTGVLRERR